MKESILIGRGILSWPRAERQTDRYGSILLYQPGEGDQILDGPPAAVDESQAGKRGTLTVVVLKTRKSPHIGDLARGIYPATPVVGDEIRLGHGTLFFEPCDDMRAIGLKPAKVRNSDWMDPVLLYRAIHQTVEVRFTPDE